MMARSSDAPAVLALHAKIEAAGAPLSEYIGRTIGQGINAGKDDALFIDARTRDKLVRDDPDSAHLFRKAVRGQDVGRWASEWAGHWCILLPSSADFAWPWTGQKLADAEGTFHAAFPAIYRHMKASEATLKRRRGRGEYWWELAGGADVQAFDRRKIVYREELRRSAFAAEEGGVVVNHKASFLSTDDPWVLVVMNSPLLWWYSRRYLPRTKAGALSPVDEKMASLPIARPSAEAQETAAKLVPQLIALTRQSDQARAAVLDALRKHFHVEAPGRALEDLGSLDEEAFVLEVIARRPKAAGALKPPALRDLRELYYEEAPGMMARRREALVFERRLAGLVNEAYGLTREEAELVG